MLGLKRGTVALLPHQKSWVTNAEKTISLLNTLLGNIAVDIQHIGSTAITGIYAKPIIDIVVGVRVLDDIKSKTELLSNNNIIYRGEDLKNQLLFVMGDFENDTRTHHIHVVEYNSNAWNNYINFRDYLNAFPEKAKEYNKLKQALSEKYSDDRIAYTNGKQTLIDQFLIEASEWKC